MKIQLSDHFSYRKLLQFTFPSVVMMIFTSIYGVVDGQGNRRTTMAEKFSEALEKQGFKSCVYYQMD